MFLQQFFHQTATDIKVSAEQGSQFAKQISNDFNPIHDVDSRRFCVPGDLLFALVLNQCGLSQQMSFNFLGLVPADRELIFPKSAASELLLKDSRDKVYLQVRRAGDSLNDQAVIEHLIRSYVQFSGQNFPYILVPLMQEQQVMINPARPLVMYQSMSLNLDHLDLQRPTVNLVDASLNVEGKRGSVELQFSINDGDRVVGCGAKQLVLSGLREYQQQAVDQMIADYRARQG